jgi:hypothetical protein
MYYGFVYRPLTWRTSAFDAPLTNVWLKLASSPVTPTPDGPDLTAIHRNLQNARESLGQLQHATRSTSSRLALDPETRRRMNEPFQLIDFQDERRNRIAELNQLAQQGQTAVDKSVWEAMPEFTADVRQPELLWAQLDAAYQLLGTALRCKIGAINRIGFLPVRPHLVPETEEPFLNELPVRVELAGSMAAVSRLMNSLPRRSDELQALGLPEGTTNKMPLFVRGLMLRKSSAEKAGEVSLDLQASALVYVE